MNERMSRATGAENTDGMHELMGRSLAGCVADRLSVVPTGPGMMGGGYGGDWGGMMRSSAWGWMHSGAWRQMSQDDWRKLAGHDDGRAYTTAGGHGWSTAAVIAVALGAVLAGALLVLLLLRRPWPSAAGRTERRLSPVRRRRRPGSAESVCESHRYNAEALLQFRHRADCAAPLRHQTQAPAPGELRRLWREDGLQRAHGCGMSRRRCLLKGWLSGRS